MSNRNNSAAHIYVDLDVVNNDYINPPPLLKFEDTRNAPFLGDSNDYFASIISFSLQTANSLPVFIPKIDKTAVDINTTIYKISFVYTKTRTVPLPNITYTKTLNVMYKPFMSNSDNSLPYNYYYVYTYLDFIKMVNETFLNLMLSDNIASEVNAFTRNYFAPFMEIDPTVINVA